MTTYGILYQGIYIEYYSYVKFSDVCQLAKFLNNRLKMYSKERVLGVFVTEDMQDKRGICILFPSEFKNQKFLETYEERLLEQQRIEELVW